MATQSGDLRLSYRLTLLNVVFVPKLNYTLVSVMKLLKQTKFYAVFTDTLCILQERFTRILIGAGKEWDGVYFYQDVIVTREH